MSDTLALKAEVERFDAELAEITNRNPDEQAEWSAGDVIRFDNITKARGKAQERYDEQLATRNAKIDAVREAYKNPANREAAFPEYLPNVTTRKDPWENLGPVISRSGSLTDLKARAHDALEQVDERIPATGREYLARTLDRTADASAAEFILACGDQHYRTAFDKFFKDPIHGHMMWEREEVLAWQRTASVNAAFNAGNEHERTALSLSGTSSMLPLVLDPSIVLTNGGALNPWRELASVKTTSSNTWNGVASAGANAEWKVEGAQAADATPTVSAIQINAELADVYLFGSYEAIGDSSFADQLPVLLADAKNRLEEAAFATGAGHGSQQPKGVITAAIAGSKFTTGSTVATLSSADVFSIIAALPDRFKANASFVMNPSVGLATRQLGTSLGAAFWANLGDAQPEQLLGKRYRESTTMNGTVATGNYIALVGDMSQYFVVDRLGMQVLYVPAVVGANFRPTGQAGWFAYWRTGGDVATVNAFNLLKVK